ncbi:hypothetical protein J3R82DRAFT_9025 [Butyriboletus roseoflavus]|nr:hypothetical protein J3R82DRAFT_9025 [Butyriboletus roseoflavus]
MSYSVLDPGDIRTLEYIVTHVFLPLKLPGGDDHTLRNDRSLAGAIASVAHIYSGHVDKANLPEWGRISGMLDNLQATVQFESLDQFCTVSHLSSMHVGDILPFLIRAQNVAVVFRKHRDVTIVESFEVSPKAEDVMTTKGKLICSYPGPAIEVPNVVFEDESFLSELVNFLVHMNDDILDAAPTSQKAQSTLVETRDTTYPRYITELLTGILRSVGSPANIVRISKRVGDDVVWNNSKLPWRRSSLWLLIRVTLQTSLDRSNLGHRTYKEFMLFFMCHLAREKISADLPNHVLHSMAAKISRRLRKLGSSAPDWLSRAVLQTCSSLRSTLEKRWGQVQAAQRVSPDWSPSHLNLTRDIQLSLLGSGDYLRNALANHDINPPHILFKPEHRPRGTLDDFLSSNVFEDAYRTEPHVALYDVEQAVEQSIDSWVDQVRNNNKACVKLEVLANKYSSNALRTYTNNPELLSVMLLTMFEFWIALDKIAIKDIPMLAEYSPEVPTSLLEDLLLCKTGSLHRLNRAHEYLSHRHFKSQGGLSVFSQTVTADSFAVRFYRSSSHLQRLKTRIEEVARDEVRAKCTELERANARYTDLEQQATEMDHEYAISRDGFKYHARHRCSKCFLEIELEDMEIAVHEWPLPAERLRAEAVVFELNCPIPFNMWRTATFHLLVDLCSSSVEAKNPYIQLSEYAALQPYLVKHPRSRISLASDTKPFAVTHYSKMSIPTTQEQVCVNNGLKLYGFDSHACIPVSEAFGRANISRYCTYKLRSGPYQNLQKYVDATTHTSNEVVANQADCHKNLSIHEFMAFGHLRSGGLLQWLNILRELRGRSLSFHRHEVHLLLAQAVSQVGPFANTGWMWHQEIQQPSFCYALLGELESLLQDVEANWLEAVTMDTISLLLRRLLASSPDEAVSEKVLGLLRTTRGKVFSWVQELLAKLAKTPGDEEVRRFLRGAAAICRSTFDVDPAMVRRLLHSAQDIEVLLSSAIIIHDHTPSKVTSLPAYTQLLLDRDRRLSLALETVLSDIIQVDRSDEGIDLAVRRVWPHYRPDSKWTPLQNPNSRWFSCTTAPTVDQCSQVVHFNLLDGSLLVNGKPLGRLPNEIQRHPLYNLLFGEQVLEVVPSDLPGMEYSTRSMISGHQVYFSLRSKSSDLVIRAHVDSQTIELIPQEKLKGDLPCVLIEGHAHWLNLSTSVMEIRPLDNLWKASPENWMMRCTPRGYRMYKGRERLIDIRSPSWAMVSDLLKPLDAPWNLLVTVSLNHSDKPSSSSQLSVALPRYRLSFYVDEDGDLQSHNIRGMVYDENQSIGTLFGLVNRLVLRPKLRENVDADELVQRCVLIPEGAISFQMDGHHVRVEIDTRGPALQRVTYQTYRVDIDLGCLTGNGSLTNKLYCAYLHALTSGCSTDSLTGRSGTEEALSLLRSASCWSIMRFDSRDAELLSLIASVCPSRTWYPQHLKSMQKVEWLNLPVNSQHHELYVVSKGIKEYYERVQLFHKSQSTTVFEGFPSQNSHLLERSALRVAYLFPSEFSGQPSGADFDVRYRARDLVEVRSGEHRAYTAATVVHRRTGNSTTPKNILNMMESWKGIVEGDAALSLRYDKESWLAPDLPSIWLKAYDLLRRSDERKWFQLLFSLPAMAYASSEHTDLVSTLVAFAADSMFRLEDPPCYDSYNLSDAYYPSSTILRSYISECAHSFERSPESTKPAQNGENSKKLRKRQLEMYKKRRNSDTEETVRSLLKAWPCETPPQCSLNADLYDVTVLTSLVQRHFSDCYHNLKLKQHVARVQRILNSVHSQVFPTPTYSFRPSKSNTSCIPWPFTVDQLFARHVPSMQARGRLPRYTADAENTSISGLVHLHQLITTAEANAVNPFQRQYVSALRTSAEYFGSETEISLLADGTTKLSTAEALLAHYNQCSASYIKGLHHVKQCLGPRSQSEQALEQSGQWPRVTPHALFRLLASNSSIALSDEWKRCLIRLALLVLELQRARRLLRLHLDNLHEELRRELQNEGCDGWNAEAHPDWLLIQLQGNFLVRRVQADVAKEMITPRSGTNNTAMQLNMGEGKSSVIVPIVVVTLADGDQLVRVIVPKALTAQMFHLLADRLGGLVNRRIYFIPFSRSLEVDGQKVAALRELMSECMKQGGILVVQPEHILSLRLVSVEKQLPQAEDGELANLLLKLQKWLHSHSRDILDESDEILHVRYQLVYTIGHQQHMQGFPERWTTTEQVLSLVSKHASSLRELFPLGVEYERGPPGSFPHLRILHTDAGQELISWIVQDVMNGLLPNFSFGQLRLGLRDAIRSFISCADVSPETVQLVKEYCQQTPLWGGLLLLRGLLATGILLFAFRERRWRVDYGLHPLRTMLAVPYRAKDIPAQRAEFGHPDIAIILTCLSYYYGGLSEGQLKVSFEILLKQDDPSLDYDLWSSEQWNEFLVPLFSRNRATVDFYLSSVVFPKDAKEFPSKLSCSGWDLAEKKDRLLTGFSGTNDSQHLLPLHITQRDPDHQRGTNAKVLSYLLQPENKHYMCMTKENGERRTTREFLKMLVAQQPEIRVLLDVGAQMLDLQNDELARAWLNIKPGASAAIYFNEDDELTVRARDGTTQLLISSPFAQQLDQCVVYLDDAHTRGTDIKFPSEFRAAVTLGPKVTKDRLAQGCMRMRKLGHGHSIMFFAPLEVDRRIRSVAGKDRDRLHVIDTMDILHWAIRETCDDIQQRAPLWAQQGIDHTSRYAAWTSFRRDELSSKALSEKWLQPEAKRLEDLYGPHNTSKSALLDAPRICRHCIKLGVLSLRDVNMDEEQEREVIHEIERERQVERPPRVPPAGHSLHQDVIDFIMTGVILTNTTAFRPAFGTLDGTSAITTGNEAHVWSPFVLGDGRFSEDRQVVRKFGRVLAPCSLGCFREKRSKRCARHFEPLRSQPLDAVYQVKQERSPPSVHIPRHQVHETMR